LSSPLHLRYQALFMMMFWTMLTLGVAWTHWTSQWERR
jgi:hypothetical protein